MRAAFFKTLMELAEVEERIHLIVGDLGFGVVEPFANRFPDRFLNVGVAEQNMSAVATGMALSGKIVFTYSIANFPTLRCLEQIRNDICYHSANVKIVAVGGGFAYGALGVSHHATEDLAIMRALPRMTVVAPGDPRETAALTRAITSHPGPCYLRLGRAGEAIVHTHDLRLTLGIACTVRRGADLTLISTGGMLETAVRVADRLASVGVQTGVLSMHTLKPLDAEGVLAAARETRAMATLEEHSVIGGLGSAVAEVLVERPEIRVPFKMLGLPSAFVTEAGSQTFLRDGAGLSEDRIVKSLVQLMSLVKSDFRG